MFSSLRGQYLGVGSSVFTRLRSCRAGTAAGPTGSDVPASCPTAAAVCLFDRRHPSRWHLSVGSIRALSWPTTLTITHLLLGHLCVFSECPFRPFVHFHDEPFIPRRKRVTSSLCVSEIQVPSPMRVKQPLPSGGLSPLSRGCLLKQVFLISMESSLSSFVAHACVWCHI